MRLWHLYLAAVILLVGVSLCLRAPDAFAPGPQVKDPGKSLLDVMDSAIKLLVALNTAMVTAAAALTVKGHTWSAGWGKADSLLILAVFLCGAVAYTGGYVCYMRILTMLSQAQLPSINVLEGGVLLGLRLQYGGIIAGYMCLGLVFTRMIEGRMVSAPPSR